MTIFVSKNYMHRRDCGTSPSMRSFMASESERTVRQNVTKRRNRNGGTFCKITYNLVYIRKQQKFDKTEPFHDN